MRASLIIGLVSLLGAMVSAAPVQDLAAKQDSELPRLVVYFQTNHDSQGNPISMFPLVHEQGIALTHLIVSAFHINAGSDILLNDFPPSHPSFNTLWNETQVMKNAGVRIMGMVGGYSAGSWTKNTLDGNSTEFEKYYGQLHDAITAHGLQGMDLDVEQRMSQSGIARLVSRLRKDFGPDFTITLAPVATDISSGDGLSGFSYAKLDDGDGDDIDFYNVQYYESWGDLNTPDDYEAGVEAGFDASRLVAGQLTAPANGDGFTPFDQLNKTVETLRGKYGQIGGIMGWEYFNGAPGGEAAPWKWAQEMTEILRPGMAPKLSLTSEEADVLDQAFEESRTSGQPGAQIMEASKPDYRAMVGGG